MFRTMNSIFNPAKTNGFRLYRRYEKGKHWKASIATTIIIIPTYQGCSAYPIIEAMGCKKTIPKNAKSKEVPPTIVKTVE